MKLPLTSYQKAPFVIPSVNCSGGQAFPSCIRGCFEAYTLASCTNKSLSGEGL